MKMRLDWWVVLVVAALWASASATALRNSQESGLRSRRRFSSPSAQDADSAITSGFQTTPEYSAIRSRGSRRRDDTDKSNVIRTRSRSNTRNQESEPNKNEVPLTTPQTERNERISSTRNTHIRTRKKPIEVEADKHIETVSISEPSYIRSRQKTNRYIPRPSTSEISPSTENLRNYKFKSVSEETTRSFDSSTASSSTHFQPRSRGTTSRQSSESTTQKKIRSRINTRVLPTKSLPDHDASSSTITENIMQKESIAGRSSIDYRNARKLRYRTKLSDSDSNATGKGVSTNNDVPKSSQNKAEITSQDEVISSTGISNDDLLSSTEATSSTSPVPPSTARQPGVRGKINFRPLVKLPKTKSDVSEISEDDNYPESFKALIQAKNAAPHANSTPRESLSVKASQKVYKTQTPPSQTSNTTAGPEKQQKFRRFYKQSIESKSKESLDNSLSVENTIDLKNQSKKPDIKNRTSYFSKYRKSSTFNPSTSSTTTVSSINSERSRYKFNRKFKVSTTESSKLNANNVDVIGQKKALTRTSYYSRLRSSRVGTTSTEETGSIYSNNVDSTEATKIERQPSLSSKSSTDRSSNYQQKQLEFETTESSKSDVTLQTGSTYLFQSRNLNKNDMESLDENEQIEIKNKDNVVVIPLSESKPVTYKNEDINGSEESENIDIYQMMYTTPKYHSSYRDENQSTPEIVENLLTTVVPPITNFHSRKNMAKMQKEIESNFNNAHTKTRDQNIRKFTGTFSKSTTAMMNGITAEPDKSKGRYSSKYRGHVDRPFYNPTVPSVTPSTAWLKFYVTDKQLTKSIQDPDWFEEEQNKFRPTPMMGHYIIATSPIIHESSIELVEGEESQLGPDMNAISFSQTPSTLTSADLKLSESVLTSSHIMNIEALRHSPSVTISIFDALAEILTSTPKPQKLSTTESVLKRDNNEVTLQTFNGVSNTINVNNLQKFEHKISNVSINTDVNNNETVQITEQIMPVVNNQGSVEENTLQQQTIEEAQIPLSTASTPKNIPIPISSTPISARQPFAIKILYTNTNDPLSPSTITPESRQNWSTTTDNPTTVYNTVSDLILTNNNLVSSELTNVLSNNIQNILKNMDEEKRSKISEDMANLLKSLIPRALDSLSVKSDDVNIEPNTTPYSLEDLKDTEVITGTEVNNKNIVSSTTNPISTTENIFQTLRNEVDINIDNLINVSISVNSSDLLAVNSSTERNTNILSETNNQQQSTITLPDITTITQPSFSNDNIISTASTPTSTMPNILPIPFLTNVLVNQDDADDATNNPTKENAVLVLNEQFNEAPKNITLTKSNDQIISPGQLWLLSKKASLLKVIEDLIQQHNIEISTATNSNFDSILNSAVPSLSERLTKLVTDLNMTDNSNLTNIINSEKSESPIPKYPTPNPTTVVNSEDTSISSSLSTTTMETILPEMITTLIPQTTESIEMTSATNTEQFETTTEGNFKDTTVMGNMLNNSQLELNISFNATESTIQDVSTISNINNLLQKNSADTSSGSSPPKKDYVVFGILPNNTVVRKDPNDNELESLTEASPYIIYGVLPNNTIIRKFPNGTRVPRVMEKIDILPISPWTLQNPYSPIHNNPAIVKPKYNPIRVISSTEITNNEPEDELTNNTVNNNIDTIPTSTSLNVNDSSFVGITTITNNPPAEASTASHVLNLRTTTMLPSVDEILLNSISSAAKEDQAKATITTSTMEPQILTLDIDPETKQIRTEKPNNDMGSAIFKFIPIENVTSSPQETNVFKLSITNSPMSILTTSRVESTEGNTQTPQISLNTESTTKQTTNTQLGVTQVTSTETFAREIPKSIIETTTGIQYLTTPLIITRLQNTNTNTPPTENLPTSYYVAPITTTNLVTTTQSEESTTETTTQLITITNSAINQNTQSEIVPRGRSLTTPGLKQISIDSATTTSSSQKKTDGQLSQQDIIQLQDDAKILRSLLLSFGNNPTNANNENNKININVNEKVTPPDIKQFEEDLKLLKILLETNGQTPPSTLVPNVFIPEKMATTTPLITTVPITTTTTILTSTTPNTPLTSTISIEEDIKKFQEDAQLLKILLQATGQNPKKFMLPVLSDVNIRKTTTSSIMNSPTISTESPLSTSSNTGSIIQNTMVNLQSQQTSTTTFPEDIRISTTLTNQRRRIPTTTMASPTTTSRRLPFTSFVSTTEIPRTSTFSVDEDLAFLENLKNVLNNDSDDPETALANRIIALAVDRSLNEIKTNTDSSSVRSGKAISGVRSSNNRIITTTTSPTTTVYRRPTTTQPATRRPITVQSDRPSIEDDIRQFEEDSKLLQALLKATGQDPSKFNIPTITNAKTNVRVSSNTLAPNVNDDLKLLSNLLASPSPLNEPFDSLTKNTASGKLSLLVTTTRSREPTSSIKNDIKILQDDPKFLQTLIKLQDNQEITTQRNKIVNSGLTSDEALSKLLKQQNSMVSEATRTPLAVSTEYGKSNDALLAALLKEQGFGPTTASSLDEQLRLAALLNQVVVTPKARRTTTTAVPPTPRRPIIDGLAWLWQQWRETAPGPARPNRRPAPTVSTGASSNRATWFGSGPLVGNTPKTTSSNRIPLEPPHAVASEQSPGRGQIVSAAINVSRAFSQFLGAAIQGAAQTVQNVIRAGQKAATDVYTTGSG